MKVGATDLFMVNTEVLNQPIVRSQVQIARPASVMNIMRQFVGVGAVFGNYPKRCWKCSIASDNLDETCLGIPALALTFFAANFDSVFRIIPRTHCRSSV